MRKDKYVGIDHSEGFTPTFKRKVEETKHHKPFSTPVKCPKTIKINKTIDGIKCSTELEVVGAYRDAYGYIWYTVILFQEPYEEMSVREDECEVVFE